MYYTLKGRSLNPNHKVRERWIQFDVRANGTKVNPILSTRCQYTWVGVVAFRTIEDAKVFAFNFDNSDDRREGYHMKWEVIPYRSNALGGFRDTITKYGKCLTRFRRA